MSLPSLFDVRPDEEGGPIARTGFDFQDELTVSLLVNMLSDAEIESVLCETHDDVVVYRIRSTGASAEFVQVKAEEPYQYWSVAMLCERTKDSAQSLVEKSLSHDRFREESLFRVVTAAPVSRKLAVLCKPPASRDAEDAFKLNEIYRDLLQRLGEVFSQKGNDLRYWLEHCWWDVRYDRHSIVRTNLMGLLELAQREQRLANWHQLNEFRRALLALVQSASSARASMGVERKVIRRQVLRTLWEQIAPLSSLQYGPQKRIADFQRSYLVSEAGEVPFGGREDELAALNAWLASVDGGRRAIVVAPSGRGKSALLVHWLLHVQDSPNVHDWKVVFVPISMRYGTHLPSVFWLGIAVQLAQIFGEKLPAAVGDAGDYYADVCATFLGRLAHLPQKIVLIVDGIDEALDQGFSCHIFPDPFPPNLKVLLSARQLADDDGPNGWLRRLGWQTHAQTFSVPLLSARDIEKLLLRFDLLPEVGVRTAIVEILQRLTEGEPLLIMLYIEDLRRQVRENGGFQLEDLSRSATGFTGYVSDWIECQQKAWAREKQNFDTEVVDATFAVLSCAFGPLASDSLIRLVAQVTGRRPVLSVAALIRPIQRFVVGDGTTANGYVFSHPKLGQYFTDSYLSAEALQRVHSAFVEWGRETVERLNKGELKVDEVPPYLLQHHVRHLVHTNSPTEDLCGILSTRWQSAWENFEGGYRGFAENIRLLLKALGPLPSWDICFRQQLLARLHASLCLSTLHSFGASLPLDLMVLAVNDGIVTRQQAVHYIEMHDAEFQLAAYCRIFRHLSAEQREDVVSALPSIADPHTRAQNALSALANTNDHLQSVLHQIIEQAIPGIERPFSRLALLVDWLSFRGLEYVELTLAELAATAVPADERAQISLMYGKVIRYLISVGRHPDTELWDKFFDYFLVTSDLSQISRGLIGFIDILRGKVDPHLLTSWRREAERIFAEALSRQDDTRMDVIEWSRLSELGRNWLAFELLLQAPDGAPHTFPDNALALISRIRDPYSASEVLIECLPLFLDASRQQAAYRTLSLVQSLDSANNRTHALLSIASKLRQEDRGDVIREALKHAKLIEDTYSTASAVVALYAYLGNGQRAATTQSILQAISNVSDIRRRGGLLVEIGAMMDREAGLPFAVAGYRLIDSPGFPNFRDTALINALTKLPEELRQEAFNTCMRSTLSWSDGQIFFFTIHARILAETVPQLWAESDLDAVLGKITSQLQFSTQLLAALAPVARRFNRADLLQRIVEMVCAAREPSQARALVDLYVSLGHPDPILKSIVQCFELALASLEGGSCARVLAVLIPYLPSEMKARALDAAICAAESSELGERADVLRLVAEVAEQPEVKTRLLCLAFEVVERLDPVQRLEVLRRLVPHCNEDMQRKARFWNIVTEGLAVPRSSLLSAVEAAAPLLSELGGDDLLTAVLEQIVEVTKDWA